MLIIDLIALGICLALLIHRRHDESRVRAFVRSLGPLPREKRAAALRLASACNRLPDGPDPVFLPVFLESLGATATAVIERGGCCSGRSRLLILCLAELDIAAFQITLYHRAGQAQHCLVQASVDGEPLILDPSYGISFSSPNGAPVGLHDLRKGVNPSHHPLPDVSVSGYPVNCYYDFDYTRSRTANWTCSPLRRLVYRALRLCGGERIDSFAMPLALEWPQHLFIALALGGLTVLHAYLGLML